MTDLKTRERFAGLTTKLLSLVVEIGNGKSKGHHGAGINALLKRGLITRLEGSVYVLSDHGVALYEALAGHQHSDADRYAPRHKVPSWVIISAARYGLGRSTYITGMTHGLIKEQFDHMHAVDQEVILKDMKFQLDLDEQPRKENSLRLEEEVRALRSLYLWCLERKKEK